MARFSANITVLFTELPLRDRFGAARRAGFDGIEMLFPYDVPAAELAALCHEHALDWVLLNCPAPNWAGGPRGFAALPDGREKFRHDFELALRTAQILRARHIHIMAGKAQGAAARKTYIENLAWACRRAPHASLTIEPINRTDMPGYFLSDFDLAAEVLDAVDMPNLGLQFDSYHAQMITGDAISCWADHAARVRHVQIAGAPDRNEPSRGDVDLGELLGHIQASGYAGWISGEYHPLTTTDAGLGWLSRG